MPPSKGKPKYSENKTQSIYEKKINCGTKYPKQQPTPWSYAARELVGTAGTPAASHCLDTQKIPGGELNDVRLAASALRECQRQNVGDAGVVRAVDERRANHDVAAKHGRTRT